MQHKMEMDPKIMNHKVNDEESHSKSITTTCKPSDWDHRNRQQRCSGREGKKDSIHNPKQ